MYICCVKQCIAFVKFLCCAGDREEEEKSLEANFYDCIQYKQLKCELDYLKNQLNMIEKIRSYEPAFRCALLTDQKLDEYQMLIERTENVIYKEIQERAREKDIPNCLIRDK